MNGYKIPLAIVLFVATILTSLGGAYIHSVENSLKAQIQANLDRNTERYTEIMSELKYIRNRLDKLQEP